MAKILLVETTWLSWDQIEIGESVNEATGESLTTISCPFQAAGIRNKNGRIYPPAIWERITKEGSDIQERIKAKNFHGMLGHPKDGVGDDGEVTHTVTKLGMKENGVVAGALEVNNTPRGQIIQEYRRQKYQFGISSRGIGSVDANGVVQEDYELRAFDIVLNPSTPGATVKPGKTVQSNEDTAESVNQPDPKEPVAVVEDRADPSTAAKSSSGNPAKEASNVMNQIDKYRSLEADAKALLDLKESDCVSKREVAKAQSEILTLTGHVGELDESVKLQRDALIAKLVAKREKMDEWNVGGRLGGSDTVKPDGEQTDETATKLAEAQKRIEELETKVKEAEANATAAEQLAEGIKKKNDELTVERDSTIEEREAAEGYLEAAIEIIGAISAVFEEVEMESEVEEAIKADPRLKDFQKMLEKCENSEELSETVKRLSEALKGSSPTGKEGKKAPLPPKGGGTKTPQEIGESRVAGKGESGEDTENPTLVGEGAKMIRGMRKHDKMLREARNSRTRTVGQQNLDE